MLMVADMVNGVLGEEDVAFLFVFVAGRNEKEVGQRREKTRVAHDESITCKVVVADLGPCAVGEGRER